MKEFFVGLIFAGCAVAVGIPLIAVILVELLVVLVLVVRLLTMGDGTRAHTSLRDDT